MDQSGKIEKTNQDTVLAFSGDAEYAILIPAKAKQQILRRLRSTKRRGKRVYLAFFAMALYHLLEGCLDRLKFVAIDIEYEGHEHDIKLMLLNLIWKKYPRYPADHITFRRVGKKSRVHKKALAVFRGEDGADKILTPDDFMGPFIRK